VAVFGIGNWTLAKPDGRAGRYEGAFQQLKERAAEKERLRQRSVLAELAGGSAAVPTGGVCSPLAWPRAASPTAGGPGPCGEFGGAHVVTAAEAAAHAAAAPKQPSV
jgi:hypothetical protein